MSTEFLAQLISAAAAERRLEVVEWLAAKLAKASASEDGVPASPRTEAVQEDLPLATVPPSGLKEIASVVSEFIRNNYEIGDIVTYSDAIRYVWGCSGLVLNTKCLTGTNRPKWRRHVSDAIRDLRWDGFLERARRESHYIVVQKP
jgi:hypothetical protein